MGLRAEDLASSTTTHLPCHDRAAIDARLASKLAAEGPFAEVYHYVLATPGKRLRGGLTLACSRLTWATVEADDALDLACAVEMLHEASLIHDDICDGSTLRRGVPSVAAAWGVRFAALAGMHLAGAALRLFAEVIERRPMILAQAGVRQEIVGLEHVGELALGQLVESFPPPAADTATLRRHYRTVAVAKTGTLFRVACSYGAAVAGCDSDQLRALTTYADHLSIAFQIMDDIRDVGNQVGADAGWQIPTWPVIEWLEEHPGAVDGWLAASEGRLSRDRLAAIYAEVMASAAIERAHLAATTEAGTAYAALDPLSGTDGHRQLVDLCHSILAL